jgi:hypothetical protein
MFRTSLALLAGIILGATLTGDLAVATTPPPRDSVAYMLVQADDEAAALDRLAREVIDPNLRDRLLFRISRLDAALDEALFQMGRATRPAPPPVVVVRTTSEPELLAILGAIQNEPFGDGKMAVMSSAISGRPFTASQAGRIMDAFTFDDDKVEAAAMLYPLVVDLQNWYTVYGHLTFSSSKDELRARTDGR